MTIKSKHVFQMLKLTSGSQKVGTRECPSTPSTQLFCHFLGLHFFHPSTPFSSSLAAGYRKSLSIFATVHNNTLSLTLHEKKTQTQHTTFHTHHATITLPARQAQALHKDNKQQHQQEEEK
jgi:hypothetical protein